MDTDPYPKSRRAYEQGASLRALRRRYKLSEGELRDVAPEEFEHEDIHPDGVAGY